MTNIKNIDDLTALDVKGKNILLRADLNVPTKNGKVSDYTRICSAVPTICDLIKAGAKVIVSSHFN